jgi:Flp pilus assembly protein TadG
MLFTHSCRSGNTRGSRRGTVMLEVSLFAPLFFFLMVGAIDWGFCASALISLESAARSAAVYTSGTTNTAADAAGACALVLGEMQKVANVGAAVTTCTGSPIVVTATSILGPDSSTASQVSVTYTTMSFIPIPGLLAKNYTITRVVTMRVRG